MAVSFIQQKKRQKKMLLIVGLIAVITLLVLWFGYFREPKEPVPEVSVVAPVREIKINFEVLKNPFLKESQIFEQIPPFEGEIGRENPFLPY